MSDHLKTVLEAPFFSLQAWAHSTFPDRGVLQAGRERLGVDMKLETTPSMTLNLGMHCWITRGGRCDTSSGRSTALAP